VKRGDTGKYEYRWRENGRHRSRSFTRKADYERFKAEVQRSRELGESLDLDRGKETLAEFIGVYWRRYAVPHLSDKTRDDYRGVWDRHIRGRLGPHRIKDITPAVVDELATELREAGVGEATVGKALTLLSGMFRQAVVWGRVDRNPLSEIRIPQPKRRRRVRPFAPAEVEALRAYLLGDDRLLDATLVSVLAYAGLRPQEARALEWGDVGLRTLRIERAAAGASVKATKTERDRSVRLLAPLAADLREWRAASGDVAEDALVFPNTYGGLWSDSVYRNWRKRTYGPAVAAIGRAGSAPYDLRHSFASLLIHEGASVVEVARQLGNAPSVTLDTYAHVFDERDPSGRRDAGGAIEAARRGSDVRAKSAETLRPEEEEGAEAPSGREALLRTRTADPLLTMEVLYQLS